MPWHIRRDSDALRVEQGPPVGQHRHFGGDPKGGCISPDVARHLQPSYRSYGCCPMSTSRPRLGRGTLAIPTPVACEGSSGANVDVRPREQVTVEDFKGHVCDTIL